MSTNDPILGAIQAAPVYFDRDASCEKACLLIAQAGEAGCTLAAFGETWLPGYPFYVYSADQNNELWWEVAARYLDQAVEIPSATTDALCKAAKKAGLDVVIGVAERDTRTRGTVYCTQLFISREGDILGKHRKLKPTMQERVAWGEGDGSDLVVFDRPYGRLSGLNCWEHQMVLPGYALIAQGTQFHVGCWPGDERAAPKPPLSLWARQHLLSRAFAAQAACYVICAAGLLIPEAIDDRYRALAFEITGDSVIIDPRGEIIAGPIRAREEILLANVSLDLLRAAKIACNSAGHYSRRDVFDLTVRGVSVYR